jgi:hypothetical protein
MEVKHCSLSALYSWIERLRVIGLDRQRQRDATSMLPPPPPAHDDYNGAGIKRRRATSTLDSDGARASSVDGVASGIDGNTDAEDSLTRRRKGPRSRESTVMA